MQSSTVSFAARPHVWIAVVFCVVMAVAIAGYVNLRQLDRLPPGDGDGRAARIGQAIALQAFAALCGITILGISLALLQREERARAKLLDVHLQQRAALASISDGIILVDAQGCVTGMNSVAVRDTGWSEAEALGQPVAQVVRIVNAQSYVPADNPALRALREGQPVSLTGHLALTRGRGEFAVDATATPIRADDGSLVGAVLVLVNLVARRRGDRQAEATRIQRQSDQLLRLADVTNLVNAAQDVRSVLALVTAGARDIIGAAYAVTHVGIGGLELDVEAPGAGGEPASVRTGAPVWRAAPCGPVRRTTRLDGAELAADAAWSAFLAAAGRRDAAGAWLGAPLIGRDGRQLGVLHLMRRDAPFTDADEAIATQLARLAAGAMENAWLYEELREGDRRKDEFLATLAHELRNPLAPMRNAIEIIRRVADESSRAAATGILERQLRQMVRLIDDLLDVSRITKGKLELRPERLDLGAVIRHAAESCRVAIDAADQYLVLALPLEPVYLQADHARLSQVFANLLNNAAKYSDPGGTIEVTLEVSAHEATVHVRDTGLGISAEMLPRVFDMFTQEDQSLERARGGLGIGLTLVRSVVELHGGHVEAASGGRGKGSTFTVRLPTTLARATGERPIPIDPDATRGVQAQRILVVDDNADAADSLAALLRLEGHDLRVARDGPSAIAEAGRFTPTVVLLDIGMPGMSGYDVARELRGDPRTAQCLLVALTGWGQNTDRARSREAGFDHHLVKPLDLQALNKLLQR